MASRPDVNTPAWSESQGIESIARSYDPSLFAGELAEDSAAKIVEDALEGRLQSRLDTLSKENAEAENAEEPEDPRSPGGLDAAQQARRYELTIDQLNAELANARSEVEFANLERESCEEMKNQVEQALEKMKEQNSRLNELVVAEQAKEESSRQRAEKLDEENRRLREENTAHARQAASRDLQFDPQPGLLAANEELSQKNAELGSQVKALQEELERVEASKSELEQANSLLKSQESTSGDSQESAALTAAYKQIQKLNTEMTHIYAELTMLRTERQQAEAGADAEANRSAEAQRVEAEERQTAQIGDLVADIRHLQLDLEYHQQKLDQMIAEKQHMMVDMKKSQEELAEANQQLEEKEQQLKHLKVDLERAQKDKTSSKVQDSKGDEAVAALRAEAAAKDSALIVSHYELQKERLLRERLEQKNLKLVERMQKLMMVVETMRREHVGLERALQGQESRCEEQDKKLREMRKKQKEQKAQLGKSNGGQGKTPRGGKTSQDTSLPDLSHSDGAGAYPSMGMSQRSIDSAGGRTPRGPRVPPSPYGSRRAEL